MNLQLKQLRSNKGLSQDEMAAKLTELMGIEVKVSRYGTWERGDRMMNLEQAYYCAVALDVTLNDLVGMRADSDLSADERAMVDAYRSVTVHGRSAMKSHAEWARGEFAPKSAGAGDAGKKSA